MKPWEKYQDGPWAKYAAPVEPHKPVDPMEGVGTGQRILEGIGQGMTTLGRGIGQRLGVVSPEDVAEARKVDEPLMNTGAGAFGSGLGQFAAAVPAAFIPGANSVVGAGVVGGALGAAQPTTKDESVLGNTALGAAFGAGGQALIGKAAKFAGDRLAAAQAKGAMQQSQNAVRDATLQSSRQAGYVVPPSQSGGGVGARILEGISGKYKTNQLAGIKNQNVTDSLARKAVGLAEDQPITPEALKSIRAQAFERGYVPVAGVGRIETDAAYSRALDDIVSKYQGAAADFPGVAADDVTRLVNGTGKAGTPARSMWIDDAGRQIEDVVVPPEPKLRSLLEEVKQSGGISTKEVEDLGIFGLHKSHPGLLRKNNGQSADSLLETLHQRGWINSAEMEAAEQMPGGAQELAKDMLRSALNGERVVHPMQQAEWYAFSDAMQNMADAGVKKVTLPGTPGELVGGLRKKDFDAGNAIKMIQILRDEAGTAFRAGDKPLGKAKREAAEALEAQIERGLLKAGKDGAALLKEFREARELMAKSHTVEQALMAEGGSVNAKVLGAALQKGKPLSGELRTIGAFANNFGDVAGVPQSGHANPFTILDFGFGTATGSPLLPLARVGARHAILSGPMQRSVPEYGPGLLSKMTPKMLEEMERRGLGGLLSATYGVQ